MKNGLWHVYLLECADGSLYCGVTNNLVRRLRQHNGETYGGARYTYTRRPIILRGCMPCHDRSSASRMEARIKHLSKEKKLAFVGSIC